MNTISSVGASSYGAVNTASDSQVVQQNNVQVDDVSAAEGTSGAASSTEVHISEEGRALSAGSQQAKTSTQGSGQAAGVQQSGGAGGNSTAVEDQKALLKKQIEDLQERLKEKQLEQARLQQSATDENGEVDERTKAQIDAVMTEISTISASLSTAQALLMKLERDEAAGQG